MSKAQKLFSKYFIWPIVLWTIGLVILGLIFGYGTPKKIDWIYSLVFSLLALPVIYIVNHWFFRLLLKKDKWFLYLSFSLLLILIFTWLTEKFMPWVLKSSFPTYLFISYPSSYAWMGLYATYVLLAILFYMAIDWHQRFQNEKRLLQEHHQLLQGQLQQLRGQIHPHFLFNALNVIYSLQLTKRKETTAAILQLSDILRYVLYQTNRPIPLEEEIALLENYMQFQQFRIQHRVKFEKEIEDPQYLLSPMLILPILENCYKHGFENSLAENELYVYLSQKGNHFECRIRNSKGQSSNAEKKEGIGLANLRQQLEIQYPQGFQLAIKETDHYFEVCLQLNQAIVASS